MLGTSLAIRQVDINDQAMYRCVAKTEAGVEIGYRKLTYACAYNNAIDFVRDRERQCGHFRN